MLAANHELAFLRTRALLKERADLVVVWGTPLDFRLGFGRFGSATVMHVVDAESQRAGHVQVHTVVGDQRRILADLARYSSPDLGVSRSRHNQWIEELTERESRVTQSEIALLTALGEILLHTPANWRKSNNPDVDSLVRHKLPVGRRSPIPPMFTHEPAIWPDEFLAGKFRLATLRHEGVHVDHYTGDFARCDEASFI
jgi:hypothetical protein